MKIFASSEYYWQFAELLSEEAPDAFTGHTEVQRYPNGEMHVVVRDNVGGEDCLVIGTVAPPDEQLLALLMLIDALNRNGAKSVSIFLPYFGYARQDKAHPGESGGIAFIGTLLRASGADRVITVNVHSERDKQLVGLPLRSLSAAPLFAAAVSKLGWSRPTIMAPDEGGAHRARMLARVFGNTSPVGYLVKRHTDGVIHEAIAGQVGDQVVLVDDILDTGRTLISACEFLRQHGAKQIAVTVTHGLFTNEDWGRLFDLGVEALFVTESCPEAVLQSHPKVHLVPLTPLLSEVVSQQHVKEAQYERAVT